MHVRTRSAYDRDEIDPEVARHNEEQLDRLLHQARARNAESNSGNLPALEVWASTGSDVVWHPRLAEGEPTRHGRGVRRLPSSGTVREWAWLTRSVVWLLLLMMAGVACLPLGADVMRIVAAVL